MQLNLSNPWQHPWSGIAGHLWALWCWSVQGAGPGALLDYRRTKSRSRAFVPQPASGLEQCSCSPQGPEQ